VKLLRLQAGEHVLDVGAGIGGGDFYMAEVSWVPSYIILVHYWLFRCYCVCSQCSTLLRNPSPAYDAPTTSPRQFPLVEGSGAYSVQAGDNRLSFTERYGFSLPGCRSTPFVWYAVQTTSEIVTHWPARCPSVAVFNCWSPSFRRGWCSTMEQSAAWHRHEWHTVTFPSWTQNIFI